MFCQGCQKVKTIPVCSELVTLGTVALNEGDDALMIITDEQTGREWQIPFIIGAAGAAIVDFSNLDFLSQNFRYSVQVIETISDYNNPLPITISGTAYDCLYMDFINVTDYNSGELVGADEITLEADV